LASMLNVANEAIVVASGEGKVTAVKTHDGILIGNGDNRLPLLGVAAPLTGGRISA